MEQVECQHGMVPEWCASCKGSVTVDEQSTHYVCPWCGHLNAPARNDR